MIEATKNRFFDAIGPMLGIQTSVVGDYPYTTEFYQYPHDMVGKIVDGGTGQPARYYLARRAPKGGK